MRACAKIAAAITTTLGILVAVSSIATTEAWADGCLTVDATGVCEGGSFTVGGSPETVTVPSVVIASPTTICAIVTCIDKGYVLVATPGESEAVPVPAVTVPLSWISPEVNPCLQQQTNSIVYNDTLGPTGTVPSAEQGNVNGVVGAAYYTVAEAYYTVLCPTS